MVQLGLLPPAKINDYDAYIDAKNQYFQNTYKSQAFELINANVPKTGKSFPDNWNTTSRNAPVNFSQSFSIGNQTKLFNKQFGYILGFRYGSSIFYDPNSSAQRASVVGDGSASGNLVKSITSSVNEQSSIESNGWSALVNLAYKFNTNNSISFLFMPNVYGVNKVRKSVDYYSEPHTLKTTNTQFYEQRKQLVYQLKSEHYLAEPKIKIEFNASYTNGKSSAPDFKNIYFKRDSATYTSYQIGPTVDQGIHRYYRYLSDDLFDSHLSVEFPFGDKPGLVRKLKFGGAFQSNNKKSDQYDYSLNFGPYAPIMQNDDLNQFLSLDNFEISRGTNNGLPYSTINMYYSEDGSPANHTFGNSTLSAMFVMLDYSFNPTLRFSGGLRVENASIKTDVVLYDSLGYKKNDPRRDYRPGFPEANPGELNEISLLPSTNLIIKLRDDELSTTNLRINYSKTVARPSIRELSDIAIFDYEYRAFVYGNSDLKMVQINNYDLRIESYYKSGDNISMSLFYKEFKNHIELVNSGGYSWQNVDKSNVSGIELEGKKKISSNFELSANITLIHSITNFVRKRLEISNGVKNYIPLDDVTRTMFGQAPYVLNGILSYSSDSIGLSLALSYNLQGARLVIASDKKEVPDIFELPRNLLDFKVAKKVGKNFSVSLKVRNILNAPVVRTYKDWNIVYDKYTYGTIYEFGILFKI